ncbi:zinc-binding dehydrogenase [Amycolatopsis endophytica]|uniref:S-(Hydroxymethyl)glutathione dehydrogenase/alcohol dehydrogenase n=1 Tax=Amycolatopsis endophytica TaxID=860233 RepID=A0A853BCA1_9PSEU|nr:alcohol dehydrogenase catalytic domain-containing protein [Amycolatopsis endophytica]NYI92384.1 S-(hydroxymethyl)glutathione dehydrogenase/alcohol dehydrogenase [Amycolatopsis endophytica]
MTGTDWLPTQAMVFTGVGEDLELADVEVSAPQPGEVLLSVAACGACHSDVHKLQGHGLVPPPCVFGHELSGTVERVGSAVRHLRPGDRVVCSFLVPCGECVACRDGATDECGPFRATMQRTGVRFDGTHRYRRRTGDPLGASGVGGLARRVALPATAVFPLPHDWPSRISLTDAAVLGCAGLTAYGAVHRAAGLAEGERAVVIGAGGVGLCVTALAVHAGAAAVVATDLKPEAREAAIGFGAAAALDGGASDLAGRALAALGGPPQVVFDTIGTPGTLDQAQQLVGVGGRIVVTGLGGTSGPGRIPDLTVFVRRKIALIGSYAGVPREDMPHLLAAVGRGALDPAALVSARFPFQRASDAYAAVAGHEIVGRALIEY